MARDCIPKVNRRRCDDRYVLPQGFLFGSAGTDGEFHRRLSIEHFIRDSFDIDVVKPRKAPAGPIIIGYTRRIAHKLDCGGLLRNWDLYDIDTGLSRIVDEFSID